MGGVRWSSQSKNNKNCRIRPPGEARSGIAVEENRTGKRWHDADLLISFPTACTEDRLLSACRRMLLHPQRCMMPPDRSRVKIGLVRVSVIAVVVGMMDRAYASGNTCQAVARFKVSRVGCCCRTGFGIYLKWSQSGGVTLGRSKRSQYSVESS